MIDFDADSLLRSLKETTDEWVAMSDRLERGMHRDLDPIYEGMYLHHNIQAFSSQGANLASGGWPANSAETVKRKGHGRTGEDSGDLKASFTQPGAPGYFMRREGPSLEMRSTLPYAPFTVSPLDPAPEWWARWDAITAHYINTGEVRRF